jgi:hypothetical protein
MHRAKASAGRTFDDEEFVTPSLLAEPPGPVPLQAAVSRAAVAVAVIAAAIRAMHGHPCGRYCFMPAVLRTEG